MSDSSTIRRNVLDELVHAAHTILHVLHVFCELMPNRFALKDAVNDSISSSLLLLEMSFDLICVVAVPQSINVLH